MFHRLNSAKLAINALFDALSGPLSEIHALLKSKDETPVVSPLSAAVFEKLETLTHVLASVAELEDDVKHTAKSTVSAFVSMIPAYPLPSTPQPAVRAAKLCPLITAIEQIIA